MEQVTLRFPGLVRLLQFKEVISARTLELNTDELILRCQCTEEEIHFALLHCRAALLLEQRQPLENPFSDLQLETK